MVCCRSTARCPLVLQTHVCMWCPQEGFTNLGTTQWSFVTLLAVTSALPLLCYLVYAMHWMWSHTVQHGACCIFIFCLLACLQLVTAFQRIYGEDAI